jgi:hypothetical protein
MSADLRCTGTPVSWLRLEQHHAGELAGSEHAAISAHLAACAVCAACFARIEAEAAEPLPAPSPEAARSRAPAAALAPRLEARAPAPPRLVLLRRFVPALAAVAVAASVVLLLGRGARLEPRPGRLDPIASRTKGGDVAFVLVRDDEQLVVEAGGVYREGDRWKAVVTCPSSMRASWDLVVFDRGEAAFPLAPSAELVCGNDVPLAGAFRTTGRDPMTVCLVWSEGAAVDREALRLASPETLPRASCKILEPSP